MYSLYSTRPTRLYAPHAPEMVVAVRPKNKPFISAYFLEHPYRGYMIVLAAAVVLSASAAWSQSPMPEAYQQGDIVYVSGGIGEAETAAIESVKTDYNLNVTSADKTGHYRGDTEIVIRDMKQNVLLDVTAQGPLFYAQLPNGKYVVEGISEDESRKQTVRIANGKTARVHFSWKPSAAELEQDINLTRDSHLTHDSY
jgi:hypothetical protein